MLNLGQHPDIVVLLKLERGQEFVDGALRSPPCGLGGAGCSGRGLTEPESHPLPRARPPGGVGCGPAGRHPGEAQVLSEDVGHRPGSGGQGPGPTPGSDPGPTGLGTVKAAPRADVPGPGEG